MDSSKPVATVPFEEAVLKAKVAQICDSIGYNAITQDSSNILVDIYRRTIHHLARHCKDAANNNRRIESTMTDLVQAFNFVGIKIPELKDHIETVKLALNIELTQDGDQKPSNRIQRNLLVDDLLETEKRGQRGDLDDGENNKAMSESGMEEDEKPSVPLLRDTYFEIASKFTNCQPVTADKKIRLGGRILLVASTKLKISTPIPSDPVPSTSGVGGKQGKKRRKKDIEKKKAIVTMPVDTIPETGEAIEIDAPPPISPVKQVKGRKGKRSKLFKAFTLPEKPPEKKTKGGRGKVKGRGRKMRENKKTTGRKPKASVIPLDPDVAEPPSFFSIVEEKPEPAPDIKEADLSPESLKEANKGKRKKRGSDEFKPIKTESASPVVTTEPSRGKGRKKLKTAITPLDPSIAEPPSFFPILETSIKQEELIPEPEDELTAVSTVSTTTTTRQPTPSLPVKQTKVKKKKKSNNQFAIVTETVTAAAAAVATDDKEWLCPACGGPDDGDLMVQCDSCQEWYHLGCTSLTKPPVDDENWECDICINRAKAAQKRSQTPVEPLNTSEPVIVSKTATSPPPQPLAAAGTSQDDLCPECNLPDDGTMMIQCDDPFCAKWFHGKCVNLLEEPKEDESWFCKACVDKQQSAFKRRRRAK